MIHVYEREDVTCVEGEIVRSGRKVGTVYTFLVDGMLIDTGPKCLESDLIPFYEDNSIELVTLTHSHEDHTGTASWIQENRNVPIYIHDKGISICAQPCPYPKYRQVKNLHKEGLSIVEINKKLFPKKYPIVAVSEGEWDSLHIVSSIISD
jgi:endoribonuclease LACTB2